MNDKIKQNTMELISSCIDETSFKDIDSFVEMNNDIIHIVEDGVEYFFKVVLVVATEDEYFNSIQ